MTRRVKRAFSLKGKSIYQGYKICNGLCFFKENYICESKRNMTTESGENNMSERRKRLNKNIQHSCNCL